MQLFVMTGAVYMQFISCISVTTVEMIQENQT